MYGSGGGFALMPLPAPPIPPLSEKREKEKRKGTE